METIAHTISFLAVLLTGYFIGLSRSERKRITDTIKATPIFKIGRATPGVVNPLSDEEKIVKHDKLRRGSWEAMNETLTGWFGKPPKRKQE